MIARRYNVCKHCIYTCNSAIHNIYTVEYLVQEVLQIYWGAFLVWDFEKSKILYYGCFISGIPTRTLSVIKLNTNSAVRYQASKLVFANSLWCWRIKKRLTKIAVARGGRRLNLLTFKTKEIYLRVRNDFPLLKLVQVLATVPKNHCKYRIHLYQLKLLTIQRSSLHTIPAVIAPLILMVEKVIWPKNHLLLN